MKEQLFDLIENLKFTEAFRIMNDNPDVFRGYQTFKVKFEQDYINYQNSEKLIYKESLITFIESCISKHNNPQLSPFSSQLSSFSPHFLTHFTPAGKVIGRQAKLDELHGYLQANLPTVVVHGIGGVGKTTLARKYATDYQKHYTHIIWLEQTSTLLACFVRNEELTKDIRFEQEPEITRFQKLLQKLQSITGENLLIIDNYAHTEEDEQHKILACLREIRLQHWRILLTSREKVKRLHFQEMPLDTLAEPDGVALFRYHCKTKPFEEKELLGLLKTIKYHTLLIEILAKNYDLSWDLDSIAQLTNILQQGAINLPTLQESVWTEHSQTDITLYPYLQTMFDLSAVGEEARYILQQLAVLPTAPIAGKDLLQWIKDDSQTYKRTLQTLAEKGWLASPDNRTYEMHRLIQMLVLNHLKPTIDTCENLYDSFMDLLNYEKVEANPLAHQWLLEYSEALLVGIDFDEKPIWKAYLQERLANLYVNLGIYTQAERYYKDALYLTKEVFGTKRQEYATSLNNLARLYSVQRKYGQVEHLYIEALEINKETIGTKHPDYAIDLNNLAELYRIRGKRDQAEALYQEAMQITRETIGKQTLMYAMCLNNLASLYDAQGKYEQAELLYQEAIQITGDMVGTQHPHYATNLHNLGYMYYEMERYKEAKILLTEAYNIRIATLGEQQPDTQNTKGWLDDVEAHL